MSELGVLGAWVRAVSIHVKEEMRWLLVFEGNFFVFYILCSLPGAADVLERGFE